MENSVELSIVSPMFNEEGNVKRFYDEVSSVLNKLKLNYELIFIDDGSTDKTFSLLKELNSKDKRVKVIRFRRNFGKAAALSAGFKHAHGNIIITMDGDLQDDPKDIKLLIDKINQGYDLVNGWKFNKHKGSMKKVSSLLFNKLTNMLIGIKLHDFNSPFKAYKSQVVKDINLYGEMHRYIPVLADWKGYKITEIKTKLKPRLAGKSKYGVGRILKGFLDLITVKYLSSYSSRPLHLFGTVGILLTILGIITGIYLVIQWFQGYGIGSRPLLILSALLIMVGIQLGSIGLLGEMLVNNIAKHEKSYSIKEVLE